MCQNTKGTSESKPKRGGSFLLELSTSSLFYHFGIGINSIGIGYRTNPCTSYERCMKQKYTNQLKQNKSKPDYEKETAKGFETT